MLSVVAFTVVILTILFSLRRMPEDHPAR